MTTAERDFLTKIDFRLINGQVELKGRMYLNIQNLYFGKENLKLFLVALPIKGKENLQISLPPPRNQIHVRGGGRFKNSG